MPKPRDKHWDTVYAAKHETAVSWFQADPARSRALIGSYAADRAAAIIDVGGGASRLVDRLLDDGYRDVSVLDVSAQALEKSRARLGRRADRVAWIVADVTRWRPPRTWDLWHDRAVFHFLTEPADQERYIEALSAATGKGATVIIATFAPTGPEKCSGLPVQRYAPATLAARLGPGFRLVADSAETHVTPGGVEQDFIYAVFERTAA